MRITDILEIAGEIAVALVLLPIVMKFGVRPWMAMGGFETKIEKTALETSATIEDDTLQITGADMYLSLAVSDGNQPEPNKVRFYGSSHDITDSYRNDNTDGLNEYHDSYYQVFYSTQKNPSTINNKMSVSRKVIEATDYGYDAPITLTLKPKTSLLNGDISNNPMDDSNAPAWYVNCALDNLKGDYKEKAKKHSWMCLQ